MILYDDMIVLDAVVGTERKAPCGCAFVVCAPRVIDSRTGRYVRGQQLVVVPCGGGEDHLQLARQAHLRSGTLDGLVMEFEKLVEASPP